MQQEKEKLINTKTPASKVREKVFNRYYAAVSARFKLLKYLTLLVLVLFILVMLTAYSEHITYNNLKFLLRNLDEAAKPGTADIVSVIRYDADGGESYALYRGHLAILGESQLTIYNGAGRQLLSKSFISSKPMLAVSEKYLIAYELGGDTFSVCNLLSELYTETLDYPINGVAIADNGTFAILTQTLEHPSAIYIYDKNFKLISRYLKDNYVIDIRLKKDGSELMALSFYAPSGEYVTEISALVPGAMSEKYKTEQTGIFPLKSGYFADGGYCVADDSQICFYNSGGENVETFPYGAMSLVSLDITDDGVCALFNKNTVGRENSIIVFDSQGKIIYNNIVKDTFVDMKYWGSYVFILTETRILRIDLSNDDTKSMKEISAESGARELLVYDAGTVLLSYSGRTQTIKID